MQLDYLKIRAEAVNLTPLLATRLSRNLPPSAVQGAHLVTREVNLTPLLRHGSEPDPVTCPNNAFASREIGRLAVFNYIEALYNRMRMHSATGLPVARSVIKAV